MATTYTRPTTTPGRRPMANCAATRRRRSATSTCVLVGAVAALCLLGTVMVYSAHAGPDAPYDLSFLKKEIMFLLIGGVVLAATAGLDYRSCATTRRRSTASRASCCSWSSCPASAPGRRAPRAGSSSARSSCSRPSSPSWR